MKDFAEQLLKVEKKHYPIPFWSWNDKLDPDQLRWQIGEMKKQNIGGFFMHARSGIETEYMSEDWFACISAGIEEGRAEEMHPWLYDESGWPSGFAAGEVPNLGEEYHAKGLRLVAPNEESQWEEEKLLGRYTYNQENNQFTQVDKGYTGEDAYKMYFSACPYYVDVLDKKVIAKFIELTHKRYYDRYKEEFGTGVKGFFTDEPRISEGPVPWSDILAGEFSREYGYEITEKLPLLYINGEGYQQVRYHFWKIVSRLFVENFMKQIYDWCTAHNCQLTGHVMMEESIFSQITGTGGSMPFYEYMHIPGVDWLRRTMESAVVTKQVGSVAEQLGKELVITETYALSGWDVSFEEMKWMAEWQYVNGVNLMCQHLQAYSLRGMRKRDYPPSLFIQQSWWNEYSIFNDYLARLGSLLSKGKKTVEVLLLHPMSSGWVLYNGENNNRLKGLDRDFISATEDILSQHIDLHYGDEQIIERHGKVEGADFIIGNGSYKAVVMPSMVTIGSTTLQLLQKFAEAGGKIISYGDYPTLVDGAPSVELEALGEAVIFLSSWRELKQNLSDVIGTNISVTAGGEEIRDIRYNLTTNDGAEMLFLVNLSKTASYDASVEINRTAKVKIADLITGDTTELSVAPMKDGLSFKLEFAPMQSYIVTLENTDKLNTTRHLQEKHSLISNKGKRWNIVHSDLNSMTLDSCRYRIDGGEIQEKTAVIRLMEKLLETQKSCKLEMEFSFNIKINPNKLTTLFAAIEQIGRYEVEVNGRLIEHKNEGWWKDTAFHKMNILDYVKEGENTLVLKGEFYQSQKVYEVLFGENIYETEFNKLTYDTELESIYLVGDFGVISDSPFKNRPRFAVTTPAPFAIVEKPISLNGGDFTQQGLLFFAGRLDIQREFFLEAKAGSYLLDLGKPRCTMFKLYVNNRHVKTVLWAPYELDVTEFLVAGTNTVRLELYGSNRNLFGPHHHIDGETYNVGPGSFTGKWSWVERPTEGVAINRKDVAKNYWDDEYTFVSFGVE